MISASACSDTGNVNLSSAEGNSLAEVQKTEKRKKKKAGEISTSRKSNTTRTVRDNSVEGELDRSHLPDTQYAHPSAEHTRSLRLGQPLQLMIPGRQFFPSDQSPRRRFYLLETYAAMSRKMA